MYDYQLTTLPNGVRIASERMPGVRSAAPVSYTHLGVWLFSRLVLKDKGMIGAFTQAASRSSAAILGIAFAVNIYGDSGMVPMMIVSACLLYTSRCV